MAYAAAAGALAYGAMKIHLGVQGRAGLPGFPAPDGAYDHVALRQLGLVAVDIVAAAVALATVQPWGRIVPRRLLVTACWATCALVAAGSGVFLLRALGPWPATAPRARPASSSSGS